MATEEQYKDAARKAPSARSVEEQKLVDRGQNLQSVRNLDFEARGRKN